MAIPGNPVQQWIFGVVVVAGVAMVAVQQKKAPEPPQPVEIVQPAPEPAPVIVEPPVAEVVRIDGDVATIAGTGNPGEEIVIMDGNSELAKTKVAADGTFAMVFDYKVPQAGAKLDVVENGADGKANPAENSIAVLPKVGADPTLAKLEGDVIKVEVDNRDKLTFAGMVYGDGDGAVISGTSTPNTELMVKIDGVDGGKTMVDANGQWKLDLRNLNVGKHILKLSTNDGQSFDVPIDRAPIETIQTITKGDTLWRIAEVKLGDGNRYVDIYNLNAEKINNPDLIFPDQDLIIPAN